MTPERGALYWADLGEPRGPALRRPVVVQSSPYNRSRPATVVVVIVTTNQRLAAMPGNLVLPASITGLARDCGADVTRVATIDRTHLGDRIGAVPEWSLADVDRGRRRALGL